MRHHDPASTESLHRYPRLHRARRWGPPGMWSGIVTALAIIAGGVYVAGSPEEWSANGELLMAPRVQETADSTSAFYETLSRGQVTATAAAIMENPTLVQEAADAVGIEDMDTVSVRVTVIPDTSLIRIATTALTKDEAVSLTDELARISVPEIDARLKPYGLSSLGSAEQTAQRTGLGTAQTMAIVVVMALAVGTAVQQALQQIAAARRRRRYPGR